MTLQSEASLSPDDLLLLDWTARRRCGVLHGCDPFVEYGSEDPWHTFVASSTPLSSALNMRGAAVRGFGCAIEAKPAMVYAISECVERFYAARCHSSKSIVRTAQQLGCKALDLSTLPMCSQEEYQMPFCNLRPASNIDELRWVPGRHLSTGAEVLIPWVLTYTHIPDRLAGESIAHSITTGCAAHTSEERSICSGLMEVIERDALALTWLLRRPVPEVVFDYLSPASQRLHSLQFGLDPEVRSQVFDISTEWPVAILMGVQYIRRRTHGHTLVSCACALSYPEALDKLIRDMTIRRRSLQPNKAYPSRVSAFSELHHGAAYMGNRNRIDSFGFLGQLSEPINWSNLEVNPKRWLCKNGDTLLAELMNRHVDAYVVDLASPSTVGLPLFVKRVIVPSLQPISFHHQARYLGHSRLTTARKMFDTQEGINSHPLPFA